MKAEARRLKVAMQKLTSQANDVCRVAHEARQLKARAPGDADMLDQFRRTHDMLLVVREDLEAWTRRLDNGC